MVKEKKKLDDYQEVGIAASLLNVGEFNIFQTAYREWFGREPDNTIIERQFKTWLLDGLAPYWVRSFTRALLEKTWRRGRAALNQRFLSACLTESLLLIFSLLVIVNFWEK